MAEKEEYPEHLRQFIDLVSAVLRRIKERQLDKADISCLHIAKQKGVATA